MNSKDFHFGLLLSNNLLLKETTLSTKALVSYFLLSKEELEKEKIWDFLQSQNPNFNDLKDSIDFLFDLDKGEIELANEIGNNQIFATSKLMKVFWESVIFAYFEVMGGEYRGTYEHYIATLDVSEKFISILRDIPGNLEIKLKNYKSSDKKSREQEFFNILISQPNSPEKIKKLRTLIECNLVVLECYTKLIFDISLDLRFDTYHKTKTYARIIKYIEYIKLYEKKIFVDDIIEVL